MPIDERTPLPSALLPRARVLVVDDEPSIRTVSRLMLERSGYVAEEVGDAVGAVCRLAADAGFAVILLDVSLPDRNGLALVPELRALAPDARVVLMSGRAEDDLPPHGADVYLPKPFTRDQLLDAVRAALAPAG